MSTNHAVAQIHALPRDWRPRLTDKKESELLPSSEIHAPALQQLL